jgi:hypothetical protein
MTKKVVEEEPVVEPVVEPAVDAEPTVEERVHRLEAWAREVHSTPFKHGVHVVKSKIHAFYTRPDGKIEKHHVFKIDYDAAKKQEPDAWTLDEPKADVEVLDKTRLRGWEPPEGEKPEEPETVGSKVGSTGPTW